MKNNEFKGLWISKEILGAKDLNSNDKLILAVISALDNDNGCYASFDYIVDCTGISRSTVIRSINKLVDNGYVDREYINKTSTILRISSVKMTPINSTNQNETSVKMNQTSIKMTPPTSVKLNQTSIKMTPNNIDNIDKYNTNNIEVRELPKDSNGNIPLQNQLHIDDVVKVGKVIKKKSNVVKFPCTSYNKKEEARISFNNLPYSHNVPQTNSEWEDLEYRLLGWK
ncbi:MAG: helix-turn-helix domain-containing protein [Clostridium butyricum]